MDILTLGITVTIEGILFYINYIRGWANEYC